MKRQRYAVVRQHTWKPFGDLANFPERGCEHRASYPGPLRATQLRRPSLSIRLRRLRIELVGLFQEFDNIVLVDNGRWRLDEAAFELAIQGIHRNLKRNLAHYEGGCVDRGRQSAIGDLFEAGRVAVIAQQFELTA